MPPTDALFTILQAPSHNYWSRPILAVLAEKKNSIPWIYKKWQRSQSQWNVFYFKPLLKQGQI